MSLCRRAEVAMDTFMRLDLDCEEEDMPRIEAAMKICTVARARNKPRLPRLMNGLPREDDVKHSLQYATVHTYILQDGHTPHS